MKITIFKTRFWETLNYKEFCYYPPEGGNLPPQTLLIAKMRLGVGINPTHFLQVYRADKSHTEYAGRDFGVILEQFKAYTSNW